MKVFDRVAGYFGYAKPQPRRRDFTAAKASNLTADWFSSIQSANAEIRYSLRTLRARSRNLAANDPYARKFIKMISTNVIGPNGIGLQMKVKDPNGSLDRFANDTIEAAWKLRYKPRNMTVTGRISGREEQRLIIETIARDGEILIRKVKGFENDFAYAHQLIEADHLDEDYNAELANGNRICMGVEHDKWYRPVAYHLLVNHPGDYTYIRSNHRYERIPVDEIIHAFIQERPNQIRGIPWMVPTMLRMKMLDGFEEAALVAARVGAAKMGFLETKTGEDYTGDATDPSGNPISEVEPGMIEQLPEGWKFNPFDPKYPDAAVQPFLKAALRGIASGLLVSYNTLASDLEGVNYSSIRQGVFDERDCYRMIQGWMIEHVLQNDFEEWLLMSLLRGAIRLPASKFEKFNAPKWQPRGWGWIDPQSEISAAVLAINNGLKSRTQVVAEQGVDYEEVLEQLAEEKKLIDQYGIVLGDPDKKGSNNVTKDPEDREIISDLGAGPGSDRQGSKNGHALILQ